MTVPASLTGAALDIHVGDATGVDQFGIKRSVAAYAVLHDDLRALIDGADRLSLLSSDKLVHMVHPVLTLEVVLTEYIVVRYVTVVTRGIAGMSTMHPRSVVGGHDVAVDTGGGVVS